MPLVRHVASVEGLPPVRPVAMGRGYPSTGSGKRGGPLPGLDHDRTDGYLPPPQTGPGSALITPRAVRLSRSRRTFLFSENLSRILHGLIDRNENGIIKYNF